MTLTLEEVGEENLDQFLRRSGIPDETIYQVASFNENHRAEALMRELEYWFVRPRLYLEKGHTRPPATPSQIGIIKRCYELHAERLGENAAKEAIQVVGYLNDILNSEFPGYSPNGEIEALERFFKRDFSQ